MCLRGEVVSRKWSKLGVHAFGSLKLGSKVEIVVQRSNLSNTGYTDGISMQVSVQPALKGFSKQ
jgi:hypothetical protein